MVWIHDIVVLYYLMGVCMIISFLRRLFCIPHRYEHEKDDLGCTIWVCRKCNKEEE